MNKAKAIKVLIKYKDMAKSLEKLDDVAIFDEVMQFINSNAIQGKSLGKKTASPKKIGIAEKDFIIITSLINPDLTDYQISLDIILN